MLYCAPKKLNQYGVGKTHVVRVKALKDLTVLVVMML